MEPEARSSIVGRAARIARTALITFSCHMSSHCSSLSSSKPVWYAMPTLLTRQSTAPSSAVAAISSPAAAGSARSATTPSSAPASCLASSTRSESRPVTTTRAPSAARSFAVSSPIPAVEPVTTQTRSRSPRSMARGSLRQDVRVTTLLLARHGETDWNHARRWQGHADRPLTERGRAQAASLAERLADIALDAVYASDLQRARETAAVVAAKQGLEVIELRDLREVDVGSWEDRTLTELCPAGRIDELLERDQGERRNAAAQPPSPAG